MYDVFVNGNRVDAKSIKFSDPNIDFSDIPAFSFTLPNVRGSALAVVKEGNEVLIYRNQKLRFSGVVEGIRVNRRNAEAEVSGRNKFYLSLMRRVCEYYRTYNDQYAPVINPWEFGRSENNQVVVDGMRPDEILKALIGTKFYWQEPFLTMDGIYAKSNVLITPGQATYSFSGIGDSVGYLESVPLHNGPNIVSPMGIVKSAVMNVHGVNKNAAPTFKLSRDGGNRWYIADDVDYDGSKWVVKSTFGTALYFTGTDSAVTVANSTLPGSYTVAMWLKPDQVTTAVGLIERTGQWRLTLEANGFPKFKAISGGTTEYTSSVSLVPGKWNHLMFCFTLDHTGSTDRVQFFVNNAAAGQFDTTHTPGAAAAFTFASVHPTTSARYQGAVRDIRLYNRVVTSAERDFIYSEEGIVTNGLVGYWKCDEGIGNVANDTSDSGGNHFAYNTVTYGSLADTADALIGESTVRRAQVFAASGGVAGSIGINSVTLRLSKVGTPVGFATIRFSDALDSGGVTTNFDVSKLTTTPTDHTFSFPTYWVSGSNNYFITLSYDNGAALNSSHQINWRTGGNYNTNGSWGSYSYTTSWGSLVTTDHCFKVTTCLGDGTINQLSASTDNPIGNGSVGARSQSFTKPYSAEIAINTGSFHLRLKKVGSPTGLATARISSDRDGGGSYTTIDVASLSTSYNTVQVSIGTMRLTPGRRYYVTLEYTGGNTSNYIVWGGQSSDTILNEKTYYRDLAGNWTDAGELDMCFLLYIVKSPWVSAYTEGFESGEASTGYAVRFDGSSTSTVNHNTLLNGHNTNGITLSARINVASSSKFVLFEKTNVWKLECDQTRLYFYVYRTDGTNGYVLAGQSSYYAVPLDAWKHIVVSWRLGSFANFYVDGQVATETPSGAPSFTSWNYSNTSTLVFGRSVVHRLDDFYVFSRAFSAGEAQSLYSGGSVSRDMGLELLFEEGSGFTAYDTSNNGANATLGAGTTWTATRARDAVPATRNSLAYRIELIGAITISYIRLEAETASDSIVTEGIIDTYVHPYPDGSDNVVINLSGQDRLNAIENVRRLTVASDLSVSPNWDVWIDEYGKLNFREIRNDRNTLVNSGFEAGDLSSWTEVENTIIPSISVTNLNSKDGLFSARVENNSAPSSATNAYGGIEQTITLDEAFSAYTLKFDASRTYGDPVIRYGIQWLDSTDAVVSTSEQVVDPAVMNAWLDYQYDVIRPTNAVRAKVYLHAKYPTVDSYGTIYFDNIWFGTNITDKVYSFSNMNLEVLDRRSTADIVNVVIAKGAGSEPYAITIVGDTMKDLDSIAVYGHRIGYFTDQNITDITTLYNRARAHLKLMAWPREEISGVIVNDWDCPWGVGDVIRIEDDETKTVGAFRVMSAEPTYEGGIERINVKLTNSAPTFSGVMKEVASAMRAAKSNPPGAASQGIVSANPIRFGKDVNGVVQPAIHEITIIDGVTINRLFLSLKTHAFDAYVVSVTGTGTTPVHGINQFRGDTVGSSAVFPSRLGLYIGDSNYSANLTYDNMAEFGSQAASVEYRGLDISNARNPDGSYVFRTPDGKFVDGTYRIYIKPTVADANNSKMLGKVAIVSYAERQQIGQ